MVEELKTQPAPGGRDLQPESPNGPRNALALLLVVAGCLALVGSGLCTIWGVGMTILALLEFGDWTILAFAPVALGVGGVGIFVSLWMAKAGLKMLRG